MKKTNLIIQNAVYVKSQDKYYVSFRTHDFISFESKNGVNFLDGGCLGGGNGYYLRTSIIKEDNDIIPYFLYENSSFKECCEKMLWGSRGPKGDKPLTYKPLKDLELDHLRAILDYNKKLNIKLTDLQIKVINFWIKKKSE